MGVRIATGIVLIALVAVWLFFADYPMFTMGALLIYMVAAWEFGPLLKFKSRIPFLVIATIAATLMFMIAPPGEYIDGVVPHYMKFVVLAAVPFWLVAVFLVKTFPKVVKWHENKVINICIALLMLIPFLQSLLILRATHFNDNVNTGAIVVLAVMALVWANDSGAYFTGCSLGKTKLIPAVSPNKTFEGLYGGMVVAFATLYAGIIFGWYSDYATDQLAIFVAGIGAIFFSVVGDLMESVLKRLVNIKDSGKIFPGHGGMLDRIDSLLAALPIFLSLNWLVSGHFFD